MKKWKRWLRVDFWKFLKWNYFSPTVHRDRGAYLVPYRHSVVDIHKSARLELHANLYLNPREVRGSKQEAVLFVRKNGRLVVNGESRVYSGAMVQVHRGAQITMGKAYINHGATIISQNKMELGDGILVSRNCILFDSDFHKIVDERGNQLNTPRDFKIGSHVWIGVNATLLRGTNIGDGAVIGAGAVVGGKIKAGTMAAGNPARSYSQILWEE